MSQGGRRAFPGGSTPRKQAGLFQARTSACPPPQAGVCRASGPAAIHTRRAAFFSPGVDVICYVWYYRLAYGFTSGFQTTEAGPQDVNVAKSETFQYRLWKSAYMLVVFSWLLYPPNSHKTLCSTLLLSSPLGCSNEDTPCKFYKEDWLLKWWPLR